MVFNENYYNLIPLTHGERLFLCINEYDFIFDGFCISRLRDVQKLEIKNDKYNEILRQEGVFNDLYARNQSRRLDVCTSISNVVWAEYYR